METKMFPIFLLVLLLNRPDVYAYGILVTSDRFPYQASFRFHHNNDHHCSGTIISRTYILTAGHCVCCYIKYYMLYAVVGANSFVDQGQEYRIEKAICHEDFNFSYLKNDIALIRLTKPMFFNNRVSSIPLANFKLPKKGMYTLSVWGYKKNFVVLPMNFQILIATRIDTNKCAILFGEQMIDDTKICTVTTGIGACIGDSGGPVIYKGHLVGIISFGKNCVLGYPNVHTNISAYTDWITDQIFFDYDFTMDYYR